MLFVEAIIGAGKTAFGKAMEEAIGRKNCKFVKEWVPPRHLKKFYNDMVAKDQFLGDPHYNLAFQLIMASGRKMCQIKAVEEELKNAVNCPDCHGHGKVTSLGIFKMNCPNPECRNGKIINRIVFLERSLYADALCFAKNCITNKEDLELYEYFKTGYLIPNYFVPQGIIYLKSSPEECLERINNRMQVDSQRKCESVIGLEYLTKLHKSHEEWLLRLERKIPVYVYITERYDWRKKEVADFIADDIMKKVGFKKL